MDLQLDLERLRNEIISGEEVENTLDFEAQRMAFFGSFFFFFFFPLCHFQLSGQTKNSLHKQNSFSSWKMSPPLRKHVLPHPFLSGPTVVRTQRKPLGGKINLSLIKLEVLPWVYKKVKEGYTDLAVGGEGTTRRPLDFLPVEMYPFMLLRLQK